MIHYHGLPLGGPLADFGRFLRGRHALVSFAYPESLPIAAEVCQSFVLDNGAFSAWKRGGEIDRPAYYSWVEQWHRHPAFDWAVIPDVIDGSEADNDHLVSEWPAWLQGVPVWHLHESLERLAFLVANASRRAGFWPAVALGSSGQWAQPGSQSWWDRMGEAMRQICDTEGRPQCKLHGLRMLSAEIIDRLPLASADSTNAAQNNGLTSRFGMYPPPHAWQRAATIADRIETAAVASVWNAEHTRELLFQEAGMDAGGPP